MMRFRRLVKFCPSGVGLAAISLASIASGPSVKAQGIQASGIEPTLIVATEYKSTQNIKATQATEEATQFWSWSANAGYTSEYIFRGTNLMPDSDGGVFATMNVSKWGFTLGVYGIHQIGTARANSFSIGEGGGGGSIAGLLNTPANDNSDNNLKFTGTISPVTTQNRFNELDIYLSYTHEFGPLDVTVGNIAFFIDRRAETSITTSGTFVDGVLINGFLFDQNYDVKPPAGAGFIPGTTTPNGGGFTERVNQTVVVPTVENETFDRLYVAVSAPRLFRSNRFNIVPKVYYYQTVVNDGDDNFTSDHEIVLARPLHVMYQRADDFLEHRLALNRVSERNSSLGGYLEARVDANFNVTERITIQPYGLISYSFHDRTEPSEGPLVITNQNGLQKLVSREFIRADSLVGFNNAQVGVKVPILLWSGTGNASGSFAPAQTVLTFAPFGAYSYHISDPPIGTDRNEVWGGAQFELTF